ncbi:DNA gyrase/topoisomerase IV subunit A [soil metagenome]
MSEELEDLPADEIQPTGDGEQLSGSVAVGGMYKDWFLDYASYVILERAVPAIEDGLKPVQRRILHAMKEMDDGRFNKVANTIGQTMQYHPHGDASIGDAMVNMGQKDLLIETQGNWGDIRTGDGAAAPRYIEARLSKFALEVAFNDDTTEWQLSYDGRKREPVALPMKFPLLLAHGVEGIAVGLATKVLPHNFIELIDGSIAILKGETVTIYPDFLTGGSIDVAEYNGGARGGRVKVRAKIDASDKKTLVIREIPFGTTTSSLIDSIIKANDKGKIKIKKVVDNTAADVEVVIELAPGISPDVTIDALFAFTECEVSISPNACIIIQDKPHFLNVNEILRLCTFQTKELLRRELEIEKKGLEEKWHFASLEKIFIENRIYRDIEEEETWEGVISAIDRGLEPHKHIFHREITEEDITKLTEIRIKRISKFDAFKADEHIKKLEEELKQVKHHLKHLTDYAIAYYQRLKDKFGKGRHRKTELRQFDNIQAAQVAVANQKLYVNREEGFIGYGMKKDEYIGDCSDIDDVIVFLEDGRYQVTRVSEKAFVGKGIIYAGVWKKGDERMIYNAAYWDTKSKKAYVKRFAVPAVTRDKEYDVTQGSKASKVLYFSANPNGEAEIVGVLLTPGSTARVKKFEFDFSHLEIKGRTSKGNTLTKYPVKKIEKLSSGTSTLGGINVWLDESVGRLNMDERGRYLGNFEGDDKILVIYKDGHYEVTGFEMTNRYELSDIKILQKLDVEQVVTAIHYDGEKQNYFVKRFYLEQNKSGQKYLFISEAKDSKLTLVTLDGRPNVEVKVTKGKAKTPDVEVVALADFIDIKGWKALGNRISLNDVVSITKLDSDPDPEPKVMPVGGDDDDDTDDDSLNDDNTDEDDVDNEDVDDDAENEEADAEIEEEKPAPKQTAPKPVEKPAPVVKPVTPTPKPEPPKPEAKTDNPQPSPEARQAAPDNSKLATGSEVEWDVKKNTKTTKPPSDGGQGSLF